MAWVCGQTCFRRLHPTSALPDKVVAWMQMELLFSELMFSTEVTAGSQCFKYSAVQHEDITWVSKSQINLQCTIKLELCFYMKCEGILALPNHLWASELVDKTRWQNGILSLSLVMMPVTAENLVRIWCSCKAMLPPSLLLSGSVAWARACLRPSIFFSWSSSSLM